MPKVMSLQLPGNEIVKLGAYLGESPSEIDGYSYSVWISLPWLVAVIYSKDSTQVDNVGRKIGAYQALLAKLGFSPEHIRYSRHAQRAQARAAGLQPHSEMNLGPEEHHRVTCVGAIVVMCYALHDGRATRGTQLSEGLDELILRVFAGIDTAVVSGGCGLSV